ncbi:Ulp1 protease family, C-terminal catalytic domain containing protein [Parasponia andersonii]|uniref:Ulp1 protease family, C-terminal catalytic domain containing protein n=1 Tax=Parasponia andersonii TaxID=3476 RepID=A0A2P5CE85_PARAD|nr:Ulp1 protease family, C-terminal catalytic domain containing protein [Parasponia andersonii]
MEGERATKQGPLKLDWEKLLSSKDDDPPTLLIVKPRTLAAEARKPGPAMGSDHQLLERDEAIEQMNDKELDEKIQRIRGNVQRVSKIRNTLPDKGEKLQNFLKRLEDESKRRKRRRVETIELEEADGFDKPTRSLSSSSVGGTEDFRREGTVSQDQTQSSFVSSFLRKLEDNTDCRRVDGSEKQMSVLGQCNNHGFVQKQRHRGQSSARHSPSEFYGNCSSEGGKCGLSNGNKKSRDSSTHSLDSGENPSNFFPENRKDALAVSNFSNSRPRRGQTIVLVDEEEPQREETIQQMEPLDESMKEVTVYYPSRDDLEAVEISYADFDCLAPQCYLTSTIMNFYMRYLQKHASPTTMAMHDCHFFNTYFYNKLKEAVSNKGRSKDNFFSKFRRWWKGVNIFQKEYILIPINEDLHWSLVIICIPDKKEESGPIVLHLDSLGLHSSRSVFRNIKSFLKEEWQYLDQEASCSDLPFAHSIWRQLPNRIVDKTIAVPQQKNEYDCGLFVLFFMERFIEDAPERLKKKDLAMFGKQWFKPEEASGLRVKIRSLLIEEFKNAKANSTLESSPPPTVREEFF